MVSGPTHYETLGIRQDAPDEVVRAAYRALMRKLHPDRTTGDPERARELNEAYEVLSDPGERAKYDASLRRAARNRQPSQADGSFVFRTDPEAGSGHRGGTRNDASAGATAAMSGADFARRDPVDLAGFDVFAREGIDLLSMDWYRSDHGAGPHAVVAPEPRRRPALGRRTVAWVLLVVLGLTILGASLPLGYGWFALLLAALAAMLGYPRARNRGGGKRYIVMLGLLSALLGIAVWNGLGVAVAAAGAVWSLLYVACVELFRVSHRTPRGTTQRLLPVEEVERNSVWGRAGGAAAEGSAHFGRKYVDLGVVGEIMTARLVEPLLLIPGVNVVHRLMSPGSAAGDVDHAILSGRRLALVESQFWRGGDYYWLDGVMLHASARREPTVTETGLPTAVEQYRRIFPELEIRGWYVLHSNDGDPIRTNNRDAGTKPHLTTPGEFLAEVGEWLAEDASSEVDREVLSRLVLLYGVR